MACRADEPSAAEDVSAETPLALGGGRGRLRGTHLPGTVHLRAGDGALLVPAAAPEGSPGARRTRQDRCGLFEGPAGPTRTCKNLNNLGRFRALGYGNGLFLRPHHAPRKTGFRGPALEPTVVDPVIAAGVWFDGHGDPAGIDQPAGA